MMAALRERTLARFTPPLRLPLSEWLEANIRLPSDLSAVPGPLKLWPWQRDIADAISDPLIERVSIVKAARVGFTTLLTGAIGSFIANDPAPILVLLPTEADARDYMVSDIEPIFGASPALRRSLAADRGAEADRDTLTEQALPWGLAKDRRGQVASQPAAPHGADPAYRRSRRDGSRAPKAIRSGSAKCER